MTNNLTIKVNNTDLPVKEYHGQRVVTLKEIDEVHQRPDGTARRNFNTNSEHLIEGVDYFKVCADEIRTHRIMNISPKSHEDITLITESGYLMLVKSFTDDLAWDVQRALVNTYFRTKPTSGAVDKSKQMAIEAKHMNARARMAAQWNKIASQVNIPEFKQICASYASEALAGAPVFPLPAAGEKHYKAGEIGDMFGITAQRVGLIANANGLKTDEYGKWYHDKSKFSNKEVDSFRYNSRAIERFREILGN